MIDVLAEDFRYLDVCIGTGSEFEPTGVELDRDQVQAIVDVMQVWLKRALPPEKP